MVVLSDPAAGAGSGAVAPLVADALSPSVHLRAEDFRRAVRQGYVAPHLPEARRQNLTVLAATAQAAFAFASGGYQVVVEGPVTPSALDAFRRESRATGAALHYVPLPPAADAGATGAGAAEAGMGAPGATDATDAADAVTGGGGPAGTGGAADAAETAGAVLAGLRQGAYLLGW
ncbi:ATP-binding protein [Kitasatospora sp. NBC_00458]|uniref:ATP-binding protein n=1 Tax=Kitasatospora sp. NBC_00458 TaxID=2903568 RepID=UPI002E1756BC